MHKYNSILDMVKDTERFFLRKIEEIERDVEHSLDAAVAVGESTMKKIIETTTSKTGRARAERGGHPGRVETGKMLGDVSRSEIRSTDSASGDGKTYSGEWGWLDNFEEYYGLQDQWPDAPYAAMQAVRQSYVAAREKLIEELNI